MAFFPVSEFELEENSQHNWCAGGENCGDVIQPAALLERKGVFAGSSADKLGLVAGEALIDVALTRGAAAALTAFATEQDQIGEADIGLVALLAALLVVPAVSSQAALDVHGTSFLEVLAGDLGKARPASDVVPLGALLPVAVLVFVAVVGSQGEVGHGGAAAGMLQLRIPAKVSYQYHAVYALCHDEKCPFVAVHGAAGLVVWVVVRRVQAKEWPRGEGAAGGN